MWGVLLAAGTVAEADEAARTAVEIPHVRSEDVPESIGLVEIRIGREAAAACRVLLTMATLLLVDDDG